MSFRRYGGTNKLEKNNNITVHSIVADTFTIRDAFLSIFIIEGDLKIGGNGIISNNIEVSKNISATTLDISSNATIQGNLYLDGSNDIFFKGLNGMIGINKFTPTATVDISSNIVEAFNVKTSAINNRNIIARNLYNNGIAISTTGTTESAIQFYGAGACAEVDVSNTQCAMIKYSNAGNMLSLGAKGDVKVTSKMIITDNSNNGDTHTDFDETVLIYDKDKGENQSIFFEEIYGNTSIKTGNALTIQTVNNASAAFMHIVTPEKLGLQIGGGSYPKDPSRSMGIIDIYNPSPVIDNEATPAMMIVSGNSITKFNATTGFNTFQPKYNNYAVDINGPLHLNNGEVKKTIDTISRIFQLYNFGTDFGIAVGGQGPDTVGGGFGGSTIILNNYFVYTTTNGGKTWNERNNINKEAQENLIDADVKFKSAYSYDTERTIIGGTNSQAYITDDGGTNWSQFVITGGISDINAIYIPRDVSKNFVYTGGNKASGGAIIRYGYIHVININYTSSTVNGYAYTNEDLSYNIAEGHISDSDGYGTNFIVVGGNTIRRFDISLNKMELNHIDDYTNPNTVSYNAVRLADSNNGVAVGVNVISYTRNGGDTWNDASNNIYLSGKIFNDVFLDGSMNAIVVGNSGFIYSSNDGYQTWKIVNEDVLNASGVGSRITDPTNDITSVFMPDSSTIILSIVKNNDDDARKSKLYYLNMPNIFNNKENFIFDVSGCIRMSGDLRINDGGDIKSNNETFNFITTDVTTLNMGTDVTNITMGGHNTTNITMGGHNTTNITMGGSSTDNLIIGGNTTISKIGPLQISGLLNGNVTLSNNLVTTGNIYSVNVVISDNLHITNGNLVVANTLNSTSATSGALQINGGVGIQKNLYTSGDINTSGNIYTSGNIDTSGNIIVSGNSLMTSIADISITETPGTFVYVENSGPLQIKGGAAINKNLYIGEDIWINGDLNLKGQLKLLGDIATLAQVDGINVTTPFQGSSDEDVDYEALSTGSFTTVGGFAVGKNSWLRGNLRVDGIDGVTITGTIISTSVTTGALKIAGGIGITGSIHTGGNVVVNSTAVSTSPTTGAVQIVGGIGVGGSIHTGGNVVVNSTIESTDSSTGALRITGGIGVGGSIHTGGIVIVNSIIESTSAATGALQIKGGVGIGGNIYTSGNIVVNSTIESTSTATGALQIKGGIGLGGSIHTGGIVIVNSMIESTSALTGALQIKGGVGIGGNIYTSGNIVVNSTIESTSTATGALQIKGGIGLGGSIHTGGNIIVNSTIESTSAATGALRITGGIGVGGSINTGGNIVVNSTVESTNTETGALQIKGGIGLGGSIHTGGIVIVNSMIESTSALTGALQIKGGVGIGGSINTGGNIVVNSTIASTNTATGALQITGGIGVGGSINTGGNVIVNSIIESTSAATGALQIKGGIGVGGNIYTSGNLVVNSTIESNSTATGAFIIIGGIGVGGSINTGGNVVIYSTAISTSTATGAVRILGGVGIGGNVFIGKNMQSTTLTTGLLNALSISSTSNNVVGNIISTSTATGALVITGGIGVGGSINTGGNIVVNSTIASTNTATGALRIIGGIGVGGSINTGGNIVVNSTIASTNTATGALVVLGGVGIAGATTLTTITGTNGTLSGTLNVAGRVTAFEYNAVSDMRIKKNITDLNFPSLELIRKIRPREYSMIDGSTESAYGFIAQEVQELIPKSVHLSSGYIPSIYENAFVNGNTITLINKTTIDISCGKLKLRDKHSQDIIVNVTSIQDNKTFHIDKNILENVSYMDISGNYLDKQINNGITTYMIGSQIYKGEVKYGIFVYGSEVNDFQSINKDTIWTITLSATQEMDRQLQDAKYTIRTLEERISAIEILVKM